MVIETKEVKGVTKKYKSKRTNKEKKTIIKSVYLGTETDFEVDDKVVVLSYDEYQRITDSKGSNEELDKQLQDKEKQIENYSITINELKEEIENLRITKDKNSITINELKSENHDILSELNQAKNMIMLLQQKEKNLEKVILKYESYGLLDRILKKNPKDELDVSEDLMIELSDEKKDES